MRIHRFFVKEPVEESMKKGECSGTAPSLISLFFDKDLVHQWKMSSNIPLEAERSFRCYGCGIYRHVHKVWGTSVDIEIVEKSVVKSGELASSAAMMLSAAAQNGEKMANISLKQESMGFCSILKSDNFDLVVQKGLSLELLLLYPLFLREP